MVLISSFDPVRREIAKLALKGWLKMDAFIRPAIEDFVTAARQEMDYMWRRSVRKRDRLKISGLHPEVINYWVSAFSFFLHAKRARFTQSKSRNSVSMLASELGLEPNVAKRAVCCTTSANRSKASYEGSHALIGADFIRRYG